MNYMLTIEQFIKDLGYRIVYKSEQDGIFKIDNEPDGIRNLIIGIAPPILIMEQFLFSFRGEPAEMYKQLLQKNRDMIHGAFVLNEEGNKVLFRYTMQVQNMDLNEFEGALNSLSMLLSEYGQQIIDFSKS